MGRKHDVTKHIELLKDTYHIKEIFNVNGVILLGLLEILSFNDITIFYSIET